MIVWEYIKFIKQFSYFHLFLLNKDLSKMPEVCTSPDWFDSIYSNTVSKGGVTIYKIEVGAIFYK